MELTKQLDYADEFELLTQELILKDTDEYPVKDFARIAGKTTSLVYKAANPNDDYPLPALWLPAFMNIKSRYELLDFQCRLTGHLPPAKAPRYSIDNKTVENKKGIKFQRMTSSLGAEFLELLNEPTKENYKRFKVNTDKVIKEILSAAAYAEKAVKAQGELDF